MTLDPVQEVGGFGVTAVVYGETVALGRPDLFARLGFDVAARRPPHDGPIAGVGYGGRFLGWLLFADRSRPEAAVA